MKDVVLLSEIHPFAGNIFNPLRQAQEWFNLLTENDIRWCENSSGGVSFLDALDMISKRCEEQGKTLVIRDWSHLDFTAVPFLPVPSYRLTLADVLKERFVVINTATVRHPLDQWLSLRTLALLQGRITLETFLRGYLRFAEHCIEIGFVRYEDLTRDVETQLRNLCKGLKIEFDPDFKDHWAYYTTITGDTNGSVSRGGGNQVRTLPRREHEPWLIDELEKSADYFEAIRILGYQHPG
jgi:hypothetical protein